MDCHCPGNRCARADGRITRSSGGARRSSADSPTGALYWPEESLLVVADLHLEKGSSFARRGVLLPPYDTAATLGAAGAARSRTMRRACVIALGDSFHDDGGPAARATSDRDASLTRLQRGRDWIWIAGNHDPDPAEGIGGRFAGDAGDRRAHLPPRAAAQAPDGEIAGHLHPVARIAQRGPRGQPALLRDRRQARW